MLALALTAALIHQTTDVAAIVEIPFKIIGFGTNGKIKDGGAIVMRTDKALDAYRKTMGTQGRKPTVDWTKEEVVALHAAGVGYGGASLQVNKVRKKADGALEVEAYLDPGGRPAVPTPGVVLVLRKEGIYALIVVGQAKGEVTLKVVGAPKDRDGKSGIGG